VDSLLTVYSFVVIVACLLSWVNPDPYNPIVRILRNLTEPLLWRIRKYLPFTYVSGLDLSPVVLLIGIQLVKIVIIKSLYQAMYLLK
jgi:YggT family protein